MAAWKATLLHRFDFHLLPRRIGIRRDQTLRAVVADRLHAELRVVDGDILQRVGIHLADVDLLLPIRRRGRTDYNCVALDVVLGTRRAPTQHRIVAAAARDHRRGTPSTPAPAGSGSRARRARAAALRSAEHTPEPQSRQSL